MLSNFTSTLSVSKPASPFSCLGLMDETAQIGEVLEAIYSDEEEYKALFSKIKSKMAKNEKLAEKNRKILSAIQDQVNDLKQSQT